MSNSIFIQETGKIAHKNGYELDDNPYDMWESYGSFHDWRQGWLQADIKEKLNDE